MSELDFKYVEAVESGNLAVMKEYIDDGHNPNSEYYGKHLIHIAARNGHAHIIDLFLKTGHVNVNQKSKVKWTPLHYAAAAGQAEAVELLIENKANINALDEDEETPLYLAAVNGSIDTISMLLGKNADMNSGKNPIKGAASEGNSKAFFYLVDKIGKDCIKIDNLLLNACWGNSIEIVGYLLKNGIKPSPFNNNPQTAPLHYAAEKESVDIARLLIESGSEINIEDTVDNKLRTPLHYAAHGRSTKLIQLLIDNGANVNAVDSDGKTPLHIASDGNNKDIRAAQILIENGCDINRQDGDGYTPLHYAANEAEPKHWASAGKPEYMKFLIENGADTKVKTFGNMLSPLMITVRHGAIDNAKLLVKNGADLEAQDENGWTPLHHAVFYNYPEMVKVLLKAGSPIKECYAGPTPLYIAERGSPTSGRPFVKITKIFKRHKLLKMIGLRK
jgi:ankyrin repeat protein